MGTRTALRAWQKARGLTADGYLSPAMIERLKTEANAAQAPSSESSAPAPGG
jgi:peptidoglycan hydrolase-like protein with peptidoglycan-binding domain